MTPEEKASDLVCDFYNIKSNEYDYGISWEMAKQCALIAVDEIIKSVVITSLTIAQNQFDYWQEVKQEIENL